MKRQQPSDVEARYICDTCGEEIIVPIDITEGSHQDYVEDCPVCCNPMVLNVDIDEYLQMKSSKNGQWVKNRGRRRALTRTQPH